MSLLRRLAERERRWRHSYRTDFSTPENRRRAEVYNLWFDHAVLRTVWTNAAEIAPGVHRSNQPTARRFAALKARGIRTILNLRGEEPEGPPLHAAREACAAHGLTLVTASIPGRRAPTRDEVLGLIETFRALDRPFLMHCKSGADRAGFASAVYLLAIEGRSAAEARRMLSPRFLHRRRGRAGILGHVLDLHAASGKPFEAWISDDYDPCAAQASFEART